MEFCNKLDRYDNKYLVCDLYFSNNYNWNYDHFIRL